MKELRPPEPRRYGLAGLAAGGVLGVICGAMAGGWPVWVALGTTLGLVAGEWYGTLPDDEAHLFRMLALPTATVTMLSLALSQSIRDPWWQNVLIGLAGTAFGVAVTVAYLDAVIAAAERRRRKPGRDAALNHVKIEAWNLVVVYAMAVHKPYLRRPPLHFDGSLLVLSPDGDDWLKGLVAASRRDLLKVDPEAWPALGQMLDSGAAELARIASMHPGALDGAALRDFLEAQQFAHSVSTAIAYEVDKQRRRGAAPPCFTPYAAQLPDIIERCHRLLRA